MPATLERPQTPKPSGNIFPVPVPDGEALQAFADVCKNVCYTFRRMENQLRKEWREVGKDVAGGFWTACAEEAHRARQVVEMSTSEAQAIRKLRRAGLDAFARALETGDCSELLP